MRFDLDYWRERRKESKDEVKSLVDIILYPFQLFYDILDSIRRRK